MKFEGGCYCGAVRYVAEGEPVMKGQCHCRECQYITGGAPNIFMLMPQEGFTYTRGEPKGFARGDVETPVLREFCPACGTHLVSRPQGLAAVVVKVGTLDQPGQFAGPGIAVFTIDKQPFHQVPPGVPSFERLPG